MTPFPLKTKFKDVESRSKTNTPNLDLKAINNPEEELGGRGLSKMHSQTYKVVTGNKTPQTAVSTKKRLYNKIIRKKQGQSISPFIPKKKFPNNRYGEVNETKSGSTVRYEKQLSNEKSPLQEIHAFRTTPFEKKEKDEQENMLQKKKNELNEKYRTNGIEKEYGRQENENRSCFISNSNLFSKEMWRNPFLGLKSKGDEICSESNVSRSIVFGKKKDKDESTLQKKSSIFRKILQKGIRTSQSELNLSHSNAKLKQEDEENELCVHMNESLKISDFLDTQTYVSSPYPKFHKQIPPWATDYIQLANTINYQNHYIDPVTIFGQDYVYNENIIFQNQ